MLWQSSAALKSVKWLPFARVGNLSIVVSFMNKEEPVKRMNWMWFCVLTVCLSGCATTRFEEYGASLDSGIGVDMQSSVEVTEAYQQRLAELEDRVARLEAELVNRLAGLEAAQGELGTRLMSIAEQLEAVSKQLQALQKLPGSPGQGAGTQRSGASSPPPPSGSQASSMDFPRLYEQALNAYYDRQYDEAMGKFRQVMDLEPEGEWADNAQYWIGECYYGLRDDAAAIEAFHKVFRFSKTEKDDDAQFMLGQCYMNLSNYENALIELNRLKIDYPESEYIGRAEAYIHKIRTLQDSGP